jgi:hypothetical protein
VTRSVEGCADWAKWGSVREDPDADAAAAAVAESHLHE